MDSGWDPSMVYCLEQEREEATARHWVLKTLILLDSCSQLTLAVTTGHQRVHSWGPCLGLLLVRWTDLPKGEPWGRQLVQQMLSRLGLSLLELMAYCLGSAMAAMMENQIVPKMAKL